MYCIHCGVELADSERKCPLCGTVVCRPEGIKGEPERSFPPFREELGEFNRSGILFILTFLFLIPLAICLLSDLGANGHMEWFGYAGGAIALAYTVIVLPLWFRAPNPTVFIAADFVGAALYLYSIERMNGESWFLTFALPVVSVLGILTVSVVELIRRLKKGRLFVFSGAFLFCGGAAVLTEHLLNLTFGFTHGFIWCFYPLLVFGPVGLMLLTIALCRPLRESLHKKFFI